MDDESYQPRRTVRPNMPDASRQDPVDTNSRPWPKSIGMVSSGTLPSSESETYLRKRIQGETVEVEGELRIDEEDRNIGGRL